jgi:hypothetical protein
MHRGRKRTHSRDLPVRDVMSSIQFQNACGGVSSTHTGLNKYEEWLLSTCEHKNIPENHELLCGSTV